MKHLFYIALAVILSGCASKPADNREAELKTVIAKYNNALIEAYKSRFFEPLKAVAAEDEIRKVGIMVNSFLQSDEIMEAELEKINFKEIKIGTEKAEVKTSEEWRYRWVKVKTGKESEPMRNIQYDMLYRMVKKDGKWLVEKTEDESNKGKASIPGH